MSVAVGLSPIPILQFFDNAGNPCVGGSLLTQVGGVNYPTYSDPNGTIALPNPIPLNSRGEASTAAGSSTTVFLAQGVSYTLTLSDANSNQLWSIGNISAQQTSIPYAAAAGTNTITATFSPAISLADGLIVNIKTANTTTGLATFNPNGLGALNLYYADGVTQIVAGALIQNNIYTLTYDSSLNSSAGGWIVSEPSRVTGSFTITLATGLTTTPTGTVNYAIGLDGKTIQIWAVSAITGTSSSTSMTGTGIPTSLVSVSNHITYMSALTDAGTGAVGNLIGTNGTTWTFLKNGVSNGFTNTGTKGISAGFTTGYTLD